VVSKFGQIVKIKNGKTKRRLILDSKESIVTQCARKNQRIILPRVTDLVFNALHVGAAGGQVEILVLDVSDAFWTLGLRREEMKFFVGKLGGRYYGYLRLAQRFRGAPLAWCRLFALIARFTQSMFHESELRTEV